MAFKRTDLGNNLTMEWYSDGFLIFCDQANLVIGEYYRNRYFKENTKLGLPQKCNCHKFTYEDLINYYTMWELLT